MKSQVPVAVALVLLAQGSPGQDVDLKGAMLDCVSVEDDVKRLACFDGLASSLTPEVPSDTVVTMAEFDRIQEGMTYGEVVKIIGSAGELLSQSNIAGMKAEMYAWKNANGSNMNAMFQEGSLIQKSQFGLP